MADLTESYRKFLREKTEDEPSFDATITVSEDGETETEITNSELLFTGAEPDSLDVDVGVMPDESLLPDSSHLYEGDFSHVYEGDFLDTSFDLDVGDFGVDHTRIRKIMLTQKVRESEHIDMDDLDIDVDDVDAHELEEALAEAYDESELDIDEEELDAPTESIETDMETISWGIDDELVDDYESLIAGTGEADTVTFDSDSPFTEFDVPVRHDLADDLLQTVYEELHETGREIPDTVILGLPQYTILQAWSMGEYGRDIADKLPVEEVITVPGPQIHAVGEQSELIHDYLEDNYGDTTATTGGESDD